MNIRAYITRCQREDLPGIISGAVSPSYTMVDAVDSVLAHLHEKSFVLGCWTEPAKEAGPDFIVIEDLEANDAFAWLSAFVVRGAPLTQACRVWTQTAFRQISSIRHRPTLGRSIGPWVGLITAECANQNNSSTDLKSVSGLAALSGASFCAGRGLAVWGDVSIFEEISRRFDEVTGRGRESSSVVTASNTLPIWYAISGARSALKDRSKVAGLEVFSNIFSEVLDKDRILPEHIIDMAREVARSVDIEEIAHCAQGPQGRRVEALDRVASKLTGGPRSNAIDAILGFSASLIDPGSAFLPELLRRYTSSVRIAPLWAGAFAGAWAPSKVVADNNGLGQIIGKSLAGPEDIFSKPQSDIAYQELNRWAGVDGSSRANIRGTVPRITQVELYPGVILPLPNLRDSGRLDQTRAAVSVSGQRTLELDVPSTGIDRRPRAETSLNLIAEALRDIIQRVDRLEADSTRVKQSQSRPANRGRTKT